MHSIKHTSSAIPCILSARGSKHAENAHGSAWGAVLQMEEAVGGGTAAPEKGISTTSAPLVMGGRSAIASRTVTARRGRPGAAGTAVYATCNPGHPLNYIGVLTTHR